MTLQPQSRHVDRICPSPNFNVRGTAADILLLHYTGMETAEAALDWLCRPEAQVSCHYFVFEDGQTVQLVGEEHRAWHAGKSSWQGFSDINSRAIGIEIANPGHEFGYPDFPAAQIDAVIALCKDICMRHALDPRHVLAHSDVAPGRKRDPGEKFPWRTLADAGIGHWVAPEPIATADGAVRPGDCGDTVAMVKARLADYGYGLARDGRFDDATAAVVAAFQRHFRPARVDGVADRSTVETLERLIAALPATI